MQQTQQLEKLVKVFGKGNLLEAIFVFLGGFQNMISHNSSDLSYIDHRNFFCFYEFISKTKTQPLDQYFKLKLSLQGLCLIYEKAYKILNHHNNLSAQEVMDQIYTFAMKDQELQKIARIVEKEKDASIKFLNMVTNPKSEPPFNNSDDFETKVLKDIRELINEVKSTDHLDNIINLKNLRYFIEEEHINILLYRVLIKLYCQTNDVNVNENIILALVLIEKEAQYLSGNALNKCLTIHDKIGNDVSSALQMLTLARFIQLINISDEKYTFDNRGIDNQSNTITQYVDHDYIVAGISKDTLTYLINSDDEDIAEKFEDKVLVGIAHELEPTNGEIFEDVPDAKPETSKQKTYDLLPVEFDKRKISLYVTGTAFTILLFSSILGKFLHNKYNIAALAVLGAATLALSTFTFCYSKTQQQKPPSNLDQAKVNGNENKEMEYLSTN